MACSDFERHMKRFCYLFVGDLKKTRKLKKTRIFYQTILPAEPRDPLPLRDFESRLDCQLRLINSLTHKSCHRNCRRLSPRVELSECVPNTHSLATSIPAPLNLSISNAIHLHELNLYLGKLPGTPRSPLPRQNHQGRCRTTVAPHTDIALTQYGIEQKLCSPSVTFFGLHT